MDETDEQRSNDRHTFSNQEAQRVEIIEETEHQTINTRMVVSESRRESTVLQKTSKNVVATNNISEDPAGKENQLHLLTVLLATVSCLIVGICIYVPAAFYGFPFFHVSFFQLPIADLGKFLLLGSLVAAIGIVPTLFMLVCLSRQPMLDVHKTRFFTICTSFVFSTIVWPFISKGLFLAPSSLVSMTMLETFVLQSVCISVLLLWILSKRTALTQASFESTEELKRKIFRVTGIATIVGFLLYSCLLTINYIVEWQFSSILFFLAETILPVSTIVLGSLSSILVYYSMLKKVDFPLDEKHIEMKSMMISILVAISYMVAWDSVSGKSIILPLCRPELYLTFIVSTLSLCLAKKEK